MATRKQRAAAAEAGRAFFRRVSKEGAFSPMFLLWGEERYLVEQAVDRLVQAVFPDGRDDFNFASYHGGEASGADIVSASNQLPMFAAKRVVVLRSADKLKAADWSALASYAEDPCPSSLVIVEAQKLDRRQKSAKAMLAASGVEALEFPLLIERDVIAWVARRATARGLALGRDVPAYLVDAVGGALQPLELALERIDLFVGASEETRHVTVEVARQVVPDTRARTVFELTDHLASRNLGEAIAVFHRMLEQGESPIGALAMTARQFRQLLLLHDGRASGLGGPELARYAGLPPFRLSDAERAARGFRRGRLRALLSEIAETDRALKSSRLSQTLVIERLFVSICAR